MFRLMIDSRATAPQIVLHPNVAVLIGRDKLCDVKLDDPSASRVHCRVVADDGGVMLYDAGSRWGTFVNGKRVSECNLKPGDRIKVGESTLQMIQANNIDGLVFEGQSEHLDRPSVSGNGMRQRNL
jgi:pSer/pThr/pTyr-binding forkhead associated (FHA) protein